MADFPVVGIGSSAGGLEALQQFFRAMPPENGLAFIIAAHLDPTQKSHLTELLSRCTKMPVVEIKNSVKVEPDHVYVIAPDQELTIREGVVHSSKPQAPRGHRHPVDSFFRSLAEDQGEHAIAIILSGTGTNGSLGLRFIKAEGGIAIVQDPETAGFAGMPRSAIGTGIVDLILPPDKMPEALLNLARHPYVRQPAEAVAEQTPEDQLHLLLTLVRLQTKRDFSSYKRRTLLRRIHRRMGLHHIENLRDYIARLRNDPHEIKALAADLTINVTGFFRDPEAWKTLGEKVIAPLVRRRPADATIRTWVPGCSTGEEAYSIAILLLEHAEAARKTFDLRLFATDVADGVLASARAGSYPASISRDITSERLERWFEMEDDTYFVSRALRDMITFAPQNLLQDPPFSRMDLISCRNLLIYLEPEIQKRLLGLFHFALREDGHLFLGPAETVTGREDLFYAVSNKWRIYRRFGPTRHDLVDFPLIGAADAPPGASVEAAAPIEPRMRAGELMDRALLERYVPASVLIDQHFRVHYSRGPTEDYLRPPSGEPSYNLITMAREGLPGPLRAAARAAIEQGQEVTANARVRRGRSLHPVRLAVRPLRSARDAEPRLLVSFFEREITPEGGAPAQAEEPVSESQLQADLDATRLDLRLTIEQMEAANEELKASNEEIRSVNEELQASNEELETSKEELQSLNEELNTVNNQLQAKVGELEERTNDLNNLLNSADVATLFLDRSLRIRWFTPSMKALLELLPSDIGRPITHFAQRFKDGDLLEDARKVLDRLLPMDAEVVDDLGRWYIRHIVPYRTAHDRIEGVVVTFTNITERKHWEEELQRSKNFAQGIVDNVPVALLVLTSTLRVHATNETFCRLFRVDRDQVVGRHLFDLGDRPWDIPELRRQLEEVLPKDKRFAGFEVEREFEQIGQRTMLLNARQLDAVQLILVAIEDITERKRAEAAVRASEERLRRVLETDAVGVLFFDWEGVIIDANEVFLRMTGYSRDEVASRKLTWRKLTPPEWVEVSEQQLRRLEATGRIGPYEKEYFLKDGSRSWMLFAGADLGDGTIVEYCIDVSARKRAEAALKDSERRLAVALEAIEGGVYEHSVPIGPDLYQSERWAEILGYGKDELPPYDTFLEWLYEQVHPDDRSALEQAYTDFIEGRTPTHRVEIRIRHKDGHWRWVRGYSQALGRDAAGRAMRVVGVMLDVTEGKQAAEERELLARELSHRVKNILAVVQALATQTDHSGSVEEFRIKFIGRLAALARTHSTLIDGQWRGADLKELVEQALHAYRADHPDVIEIDGESVPLPPNKGLGLSLILHELGANAARYGALSDSEGRVQVSWRVGHEGNGRRVHLHWQERGGPRVGTPGEKGFGTRLIERAGTQELEGEVELDYAPNGFSCQIVFPLP